MLMIIVTTVATGKITNVVPLNEYTPILDEFEGWCQNLTGNGYGFAHMRVTLWDTDTNMTHGSRELNVPEIVPPANEVVHSWLRANCVEELNAGKKIQAIKKVRTAFWSEDGFKLGLKDAKERVEEVMSTWTRTDGNYSDCKPGCVYC